MRPPYRSLARFRQSAAARERDRQQSGDGPRWTDKGMFWLTLALFLLAVVTAVVAFWQGTIARDQLKFAEKAATEAANDTRDALAISNRLARAAEIQAIASRDIASVSATNSGIAKKSLAAQQAATVAFFLADGAIIALNQKLRVQFVIRPSGSVPISNVRMATQLAIAPPDADFAIHSTLEFMPMPLSSLSPGVSTGSVIESDRPLTDSDLRGLAEGRVRIYAHGEIRYTDPNGEHVLHLCGQFYGEGGKQSGACRTRRDH